MYTVKPGIYNGQPVMTVINIHLDTVFRAAHLLPVFYKHPALSKCQHYEHTLNLFSKFYIDHYIDHHVFEVFT